MQMLSPGVRAESRTLLCIISGKYVRGGKFVFGRYTMRRCNHGKFVVIYIPFSDCIVFTKPIDVVVLGWVRDAAIAVMVCILIYIRGGDCNVSTKNLNQLILHISIKEIFVFELNYKHFGENTYFLKKLHFLLASCIFFFYYFNLSSKRN